MVNGGVIFVVIFGLFFHQGTSAPTSITTATSAEEGRGKGTQAPAAPPSSHKSYPCSLNNLHELQSIENIIIYSLTHECHLYAWRDGYAPTMKDVGLNGNDEPLIIRNPKTNADHFGSFIQSHGLTKLCKPENGAIAFMDRQDQQIPQLVIMVKYSDSFYSLIKLNIEELLASKSFITQSLLEQIDEFGILVLTGSNHPKSCAFVEQDLHCFSLTNDHVIKQIIYRLGKKDGKDVYAEYSNKIFTLSKLRIIEPVMAATWDGKRNDSSVYLYDDISDGWLYKLNGDETTSAGTRRQTMHKFPTTQNMLKNLWTIDKQLLLVSKCSNLQCQYFWVKIASSARSPFTCLFTSSINVITGVITDVRLQPVIQEKNLPEQQALSAGWLLPDLKNSYWPLIILASICLLVVLIILVCGFIYETAGFKRRYLIEKAADEQYSSIFWNNNGEEINCTISDFPSYLEIAPLPVEEEQPKKPPTIEENLSLLTTPAAAPELPTSRKSRLIRDEEDNKTPPSIKRNKKDEKIVEKPKTKKPELKPPPPSKKKDNQFKEIKMSTHKPRALNSKGKKNRPLTEDDNYLSDERIQNKDDLLDSIKVSTTPSEPLESGKFTPDTIRAKKQQEKKKERKHHRKSKSRSTKQ